MYFKDTIKIPGLQKCKSGFYLIEIAMLQAHVAANARTMMLREVFEESSKVEEAFLRYLKGKDLECLYKNLKKIGLKV